MELRHLTPSMAVLMFHDGLRILFSYDTPVAAYIPDKGYIKSDRFFSRTSSAHVSKFTRGNVARSVPHEEIMTLAEEAR